MTVPALAAPRSTTLLEGLVLGLALSLQGQTLTPGGYRSFKLRDLLHQLSTEHAAFATLLRQLWRLGPETYVKRELARLRGEQR